MRSSIAAIPIGNAWRTDRTAIPRAIQYALHLIQIDHTKLDIIVVDEERLPIGRPWITLAIDVYSRMVAGFSNLA